MSKQRVIIEAVLSGRSQRAVAALYGVSQPRSSRRRSNPNATGEATVARVLALRAELIADGADAGPHTSRRC